MANFNVDEDGLVVSIVTPTCLPACMSAGHCCIFHHRWKQSTIGSLLYSTNTQQCCATLFLVQSGATAFQSGGGDGAVKGGKWFPRQHRPIKRPSPIMLLHWSPLHWEHDMKYTPHSFQPTRGTILLLPPVFPILTFTNCNQTTRILQHHSFFFFSYFSVMARVAPPISGTNGANGDLLVSKRPDFFRGFSDFQ